MQIRHAKSEEIPACVAITKSLTDWFDENDVIDIEKHLNSLPIYIAVSDNEIVGYICVDESLPEVIEIKDMAITGNQHRKGVGSALVDYIENRYKDRKLIVVKTLDESRDYEPYEKTRQFYRKNGFVKVDVVAPYPGWSEDCPCAIYVKPID